MGAILFVVVGCEQPGEGGGSKKTRRRLESDEESKCSKDALEFRYTKESRLEVSRDDPFLAAGRRADISPEATEQVPTQT